MLILECLSEQHGSDKCLSVRLVSNPVTFCKACLRYNVFLQVLFQIQCLSVSLVSDTLTFCKSCFRHTDFLYSLVQLWSLVWLLDVEMQASNSCVLKLKVYLIEYWHTGHWILKCLDIHRYSSVRNVRVCYGMSFIFIVSLLVIHGR